MDDQKRPIDEKALRRCEKIVRMYFELPDPSPELKDKFSAWLINGDYCREKETALWKLFDERVGME